MQPVSSRLSSPQMWPAMTAGAAPSASLHVTPTSVLAGGSVQVTGTCELLAAIRQEGLLEREQGRADVAAMTLPPTLRLTILRRLSFLPEEALQMLRSASILGSSFTLTEL